MIVSYSLPPYVVQIVWRMQENRQWQQKGRGGGLVARCE